MAMTEPGAGSDLRGMRTKATRDASDGQSGWRIKGTKHFISHADEADFVIMYARTDDSPDGKSISTFLVDFDTPGVVVHDGYRNVSHRGYTNSIIDFDCWVPGERAARRGGQGLRPGRYLARQHPPPGGGHLSRPGRASARPRRTPCRGA